MAYNTAYELNHNFPKLAEETGFCFNTHRPRVRIDWNKIRQINIESIVRDKQFVFIEHHVNDILDCILESEFDVRILDEGVLKMFRLAQLAVEYQQFCRHYLDRSVLVLKEEISGLLQQLDNTTKELREKEEEIKKLRRKNRSSYRQPLPYGNENIAAMILKSLNNKNDVLPSTSNGEVLKYNTCNFCQKIFLNQLYLKSHISRRHTNIMEIPEKDIDDVSKNNNGHSKVYDEIIELKTKLKEMETKISTNSENVANEINTSVGTLSENASKKETKDVEVSTNDEEKSEYYLLKKIEEWKRDEHERYDKELNILRTQITDTIHYFKENEAAKRSHDDCSITEQLQNTIKEQNAEITNLKTELDETKRKSESFEIERKNEFDVQMSYWIKRTEMQSQQYDVLLKKLDEVGKEAYQSRAIAEAERQRASNLEILLQQNLENNNNNGKIVNGPTTNISAHEIKTDNSKENTTTHTKLLKSTADRKTLEELHRKAQELLGYNSTDNSMSSEEVNKSKQIKAKFVNNNKDTKKQIKTHYNKEKVEPSAMLCEENMKNNHYLNEIKSNKISTNKNKGKKKTKQEIQNSYLKTKPEINGLISYPNSPKKLVRAKITEEVNNRLIGIGVDPLETRLSQNDFQKQRLYLQKQRDTKKSREYEKIRHAILAHLDTNTSTKRVDLDSDFHIIPKTITKAFNFTSIISNVKNKALAIVKSNEIKKIERNTINSEVTKRAITLLKTPPGSMSNSPKSQKHSKSLGNVTNTIQSTEPKVESSPIKLKTNKMKVIGKHSQQSDDTSESEEETSRSEHDYIDKSLNQTNSNKNIVYSPVKRPLSANINSTFADHKHIVDNHNRNLSRTQSETNIIELKSSGSSIQQSLERQNNSSEDLQSITDMPVTKHFSEGISNNSPKQTKGVLKNAASTSSLYKKKVLFDMDAIQMKSVSASPSQSLTEKSDNNEKYELGIVNFDDEEWDISSIENENLKLDTKIRVSSRTSPKIAELKQTIESQLARRNEIAVSGLVGGVDILKVPSIRAASIGGSNTSLGSSILDESENAPNEMRKAFSKPHDDSEIDISELSIDAIINGNKSKS